MVSEGRRRSLGRRSAIAAAVIWAVLGQPELWEIVSRNDSKDNSENALKHIRKAWRGMA